MPFWCHDGKLVSAMAALASLASLAFLLAASPAAADPVDTAGISAAGRGSAGALAAGAAGWAAAYYNPAALGGLARPQASAGVLQVVSELSPAWAESSQGSFLEVGAALPVVWGQGLPAVWLGVAALTPASGLYEMDLTDDEAAVFAMYGGRERRLSLSAALGAQVADWLALGAGFELLPTVRAEVALDLSDPLGRHALEVDVGYRLSPTAGVLVSPADKLRVALAWRGENRTWLDLPVAVDAGGIELDALVTAATYFVPHRVTAGVEWQPAAGHAVEVDATWYRFSAFGASSPEVALFDSQGTDSLGARNAAAGWSDVVVPAVAYRYSGPVEASAGYRFSPSPVPEQTGATNLLDADAHTAAAGLRIPLVDVQTSPRRLLLAAAGFATWMPETRLFKEQVLPGNPGYPTLAFGGWRYGLSVGIDVEY